VSESYLSGSQPLFPEGLAFARPTIEEAPSMLQDLADVFASGILTDGPFVRRLESAVADRFGVEHCVAVSSCTTGLMLVLRALGGSSVSLPSFTFSATGHAALWNEMEPRFADCDRETWCLEPAQDLSGDVIVGVHISGVPCPVSDLEKVAASTGADLVFDAAHGAGSLVTVDGDTRLLGGFGLAEVFSLTPTKVLSGAEGGLVTTNDGNLAEEVRVGRNYGNPGDYDTRFAGLNARLSEPHAVVALHSLARLEERVDARNMLAERYRQNLGDLPGIGFQAVPDGARSSYKDFTITVDAERFGVTRDQMAEVLAREGIDTRRYYDPPLHRQTAYRSWAEEVQLPVTERLAGRVLTLPMWSHLEARAVDQVSSALRLIHEQRAS